MGAGLNTRMAVSLAVALVCSACGAGGVKGPPASVPRALILEARPIGIGPRFQPPATGPVIGACRRRLGRRIGVHIELFAANRVVLVPQGIGTRPPLRFSAGRISSARCYGDLVTIDPTGLVLMRPGRRMTASDLFRSWGQQLSAHRLASFSADPDAYVEVFLDGRRWFGAPQHVPLMSHAEIVLEVGPHVAPHKSYAFPPGT